MRTNLIAFVKAKPKDLFRVMEIEKTSFSYPWHITHFEAALTVPNYEFLLAKDGDLILGFIIARVAAGEAHIMHLAVAPEYRRLGVASKIIKKILSMAERAVLEVRAVNKQARALYVKLGFKEIYRRKKYYSYGKEDAIVMVREKEG